MDSSDGDETIPSRPRTYEFVNPTPRALTAEEEEEAAEPEGGEASGAGEVSGAVPPLLLAAPTEAGIPHAQLLGPAEGEGGGQEEQGEEEEEEEEEEAGRSAAEGEDAFEEGSGWAMSQEDCARIAAARLRALEREYEEVTGGGEAAAVAAAAVAGASVSAAAASGAASGAAEARAARLVALRAALRGAREAVASGSGAPLALAPGAEDFPDDFDAWQAADSAALRGAAAGAPGGSEGDAAPAEGDAAPAEGAEGAAFDPFPAAGQGVHAGAEAPARGRRPAAAHGGPRAPSPLPPARVEEIKAAMRRLRLAPPSRSAEHLVQAALRSAASLASFEPARGAGEGGGQ